MQKKIFRNILSLIIFFLVAFSTYLFLKTRSFKSKQVSFPRVAQVDIKNSAVQHLAEALQIKTISPVKIEDYDSSQFVQFIEFLAATYPLAEANLPKTIVNQFSLMYKWEGKHPEKKPAILAAHIDVLPVPDEELPRWKIPPFSGKVAQDTIWGRGTLDDKVSVVGIMEAVEYLLSKQFVPDRTIYLTFGHDEEMGGLHGAREIVKILKQQQVEAEFVLDEGYTVTQGLVPGVHTDLALIGIAEKGFATLTLTAEMDGGHSSMPNSETAILSLSQAISSIAEHPFPAKICDPVDLFFDYTGPEMRFQEKMKFANRKIFTEQILETYQKTAAGRAIVQTTMAPTMFQSGAKENMIPSTASAMINFRILPGTSIEQVMSHVNQCVNDDRIKIKLGKFYSEASKISSIETEGYNTINKTIKEIFWEASTAPNLAIASTDGRYYYEISENVYRFLPVVLNTYNINTMHGANEHISVRDFKNVIRFYVQLIKNCS